MANEFETSFFDAGDNTALVCIDHQQYQKLVVPQLIDMSYKVHLGLFEEDVLLKLSTYNYNVVVVYENFKGSTVQTNPILADLVKRSGRAAPRAFRRPAQPSFPDKRRNERVRAKRRSDRQRG